ncbi:MAG: RNA polymerase sigma-70 factor [Balneolaceae bacterium]|nr:RNA polymerase sigma-70 factor [Balneolaceae bacterium]
MPSEIFLKLTNRLIDSDEKAFDQLFRHLYAPLVKFSHKYTKDRSAASDIVQQAFINVWQIREELSPNQSIKTYMFRTVRNLSLNYIRDRSRITTGLETENLESDEIPFYGESSSLHENKQLHLVKKWISKLPDRQRETLKMSRFEGLSHEEIAEVLDISKRTVNNHIVHAMKKLKQYHDEYTQMNM